MGGEDLTGHHKMVIERYLRMPLAEAAQQQEDQEMHQTMYHQVEVVPQRVLQGMPHKCKHPGFPLIQDLRDILRMYHQVGAPQLMHLPGMCHLWDPTEICLHHLMKVPIIRIM